MLMEADFERLLYRYSNVNQSACSEDRVVSVNLVEAAMVKALFGSDVF
jgi:hypothetical protein